MKLGELRGERAVEVIADLIAPIASIASDKSLKLFHAERKPGETDREMAVRDISEKIPVLLKTHKKDVLEILCAFSGKQPEELSVLEILKGAVELGNDQEFFGLFFTAVSTTGGATQPTESSDRAEHSEPEH